VYARLLVRWLSERLGQSFLIENRSGAGSNIATEAVLRAAPDGYRLLMATSSNAVNASLYERLSYDFIRDVVPIALVAYTPLIVWFIPLFR
jgi:tripartite-type tricarboxylate transporter receptor subunit TctC